MSVERTKRRSHSSSQIEWGLQSSAKRGLDRQLKLTDPRSLGPAVRVGALCGSGRVTTESGTRCASCHTRALRHCVESPKRRQEREHLAVVLTLWQQGGWQGGPGVGHAHLHPSLGGPVHALSELGAPDRSRHDVKNLWLGGWLLLAIECGVFLALRVVLQCGAFGVDHTSLCPSWASTK